jgi:hypothetical protein
MCTVNILQQDGFAIGNSGEEQDQQQKMPNAWQLDWQTHKVHRLLLLVCCRIKAQRLRLIQIQLPIGPEVIRQAGKLPASGDTREARNKSAIPLRQAKRNQ